MVEPAQSSLAGSATVGQVGTLSGVIKVYQEMYKNSYVLPCIAMYSYVMPCIAMYSHVLPCIAMYSHV